MTVVKAIKKALNVTNAELAVLLDCGLEAVREMLRDDGWVTVDDLIILAMECEKRRVYPPVKFELTSRDGSTSRYSLQEFVQYLLEDLPGGPELVHDDTGNKPLH